MDKHCELKVNSQLSTVFLEIQEADVDIYLVWNLAIYPVSSVNITHWNAVPPKQCKEMFKQTCSEKGPFRWPAGVIPPVGSNSCDCCSCICMCHIWSTSSVSIQNHTTLQCMNYAWITISSTPTFGHLRAPWNETNYTILVFYVWMYIYTYVCINAYRYRYINIYT